MQFTNTFPSKQKVEVEVEVEIHPQEIECSPESQKSAADTEEIQKSAADTEEIQLLQAQSEDDNKKASESQEIIDSTIIDIVHKETETAKTTEGILFILQCSRCLVAFGCFLFPMHKKGDEKLRFKTVCIL